MAASDGNGWIECDCGGRHWGRFGAAGLLAVVDPRPDGPGATLDPDAQVLLQHRADWSHEGGTWGLPGGARDSHEDVVTTALRETWEEAEIDFASAGLLGIHKADHGTWSYTTVIVNAPRTSAATANQESHELRWVRVGEVPTMSLHPGLDSAWPVLSGPRIRLLVDVANVMGARPDGWWRDVALGSQRMVDDLAPLAGRQLSIGGPLVGIVQPVVEGAGVAAVSPDPAVFVTAAPMTADDTIIALAGPGDVVVTADAELRDAVTAAGAAVIGPQRLLARLRG